MRGRFKREGTYGCLWLIHVDVRQKPTQYGKTIFLQLKINKFKKIKGMSGSEKKGFCQQDHLWDGSGKS